MTSTPSAPELDISNFRQQLWEQLYALPYGSFLVVVARLLEGQGSKNVQVLNRRGFVGRNRSGGWDMEATLPSHLSPNQLTLSRAQTGTRCIIQVKQFKDLTVQQRTVDELRGCCLRAGAGMGLLITTSQFSPVARDAAQSSPLAPVELIDGEQLLTLLVQQGLGVRQDQDGKWEVDTDFFNALVSEPAEAYEKAAPKMGQAAPKTEKATPQAAVSVSVIVKTVPSPGNERTSESGRASEGGCVAAESFTECAGWPKKIKIMNKIIEF